MKKNILFLYRSDSKKKHGGDLSLLKKYSEILEEIGFSITITSDPFFNISTTDIVFSANIDRPYENFIMLQRCLVKKIPFCIYTLHHPLSGYNQYLRSKQVYGMRKIFAAFSLYNFYYYESMANFGRVFKKFSLLSWKYIFGFYAKYASNYILKKSSLVLVSSDNELILLEKDLGIKIQRHAVLPHFFDLPIILDYPQKIKKTVICAGRIEPRKNQISVLKLAKLFPDFTFTFIGDASPYAVEYSNKFQNELKKYKNVNYIKFLDLKKLKKIFRSAEIFISLSFFEVVSLTELEAYSAYCKMIVSKSSYFRYIKPDEGVVFVNPEDEGVIENTFRNLSNFKISNNKRKNSLLNGKIRDMSSKNIKNNLKTLFSII
jgi:glycosyltransferase involved in cell wall biosynthesis